MYYKRLILTMNLHIIFIELLIPLKGQDQAVVSSFHIPTMVVEMEKNNEMATTPKP